MTKYLKFFKIDETCVYRDGYIYSFYRDLDPSKPNADRQWLASFHCSLKDKESCHGRVHTTAKWEIDKRGRKFQWGIHKNENHSHEPVQIDTTRILKFYKNDESSVIRNGFTYAFYRDLDRPKPSDFQWCMSYHCQTSANNQDSCRARIYTTGQWNIDKQGKEYQCGTFKNCEHSHEIQQANHKCNLCSYSSSRSNDITVHMRSHTGERPYGCDECSYATTTSSALKNHMRTHTGEKPYTCDRCSYATVYSGTLKRHIRSHTGEKPFKCSMCSYASRDISHLKRHMRTNHSLGKK